MVQNCMWSTFVLLMYAYNYVYTGVLTSILKSDGYSTLDVYKHVG